MKKQLRVFWILGIIIFVSISFICFINLKNNNMNVKSETLANLEGIESVESIDEMINISECSEDFMEEYFEDVELVNETNNKENILIVTSKEDIQETYGAFNIIEAPNNQYMLQYSSKEEKDNALEQLNQLNDMIVEENLVRIAFDYNSWGIEKIGLDYAIQTTETREDLNEVTVAIIDSGCNMELFNQYYADKIVETYNIYDSNNMYDNFGHGTHIAGTIAESTPSNVKILPVKVSDNKYMYTTDIIAAINYITYYEKADVINMSFGSYYYSEAEYQAIKAANQKNIICVAAAGNDNESTKSYPAAFDNTISISSVDSNFNKSEFSNYGPTITFAAPGTDIISINGTKSGTSMATPHAVSAIAILKSYNKNITLEDTIELLKKHVIDLGDDGYDNFYGYGVINFNGAEFYDGTNGDEYNVFKNDENDSLEIIKIEANPYSVKYNYGNITNIMNAELKFYYTENDYYIKQLGELDDVEIIGYDSNDYNIQTVNIKYQGIEVLIEVDNQNATLPGWEYEILEDNTVNITKILHDTTYKSVQPIKVYIPKQLEEHTVTKIGSYAFKTCYKVKSVIIPNTVIELADHSFYSCDALEEIVLSENINKIGEGAFYDCYKLENVTIPKNVTIINQNTFRNCKSLQDINLSNNLTSIGAYAFSDCISLVNIDFPDTLTYIDYCGMAGCTSLKKLEISKNLTFVGDSAFDGCSGLEEIIVDEENPVYDSRNNCNSLIETETNTLIIGSSNSEVPSTVKTIGLAFKGNTKLTNLIIHEGVEKISWQAFRECYNLLNLLIPESVTQIDPYAFYYCDDIITLWVHKNSYAETFAIEKEINYRTIEVVVTCDKNQYNVFETVDSNTLEFNIRYDDETTETITENLNITYKDGKTSFGGDDTYFIVSTYVIHDGVKLYVEKMVPVTITKSIPEYTVPTDIKATSGQALSEIELPEGFEWMDETNIITGVGNIEYQAKYIPADLVNYEIIENINIIVNVKKIVGTSISLKKLEYMAFETVNPEDIKISIQYYNGEMEYITEGFIVEYPNENTSFRYGDAYVIIQAYNDTGAFIEVQANVTVVKAMPEYIVPTNIEATFGQILSEIELPEGFEWMDETQNLTELGNVSYKVRYIPSDLVNYEIVENIEININVLPIIVDLPFVDIKETDWFYSAVKFVYKNGYILGTTETTYEPGTKLTRGMIVTILNRMEGNNKPDVECKFSDVKQGEYYYNSVKWATEAGIVHGYEDGKFRPNKAITREELAVILRNYTRYKGVDTNLTADLSGFNDGDTVSSFARTAIEWAVARGVITGYTHNNTIAPQGVSTRDVAASVIYKYFKTAPSN